MSEEKDSNTRPPFYQTWQFWVIVIILFGIIYVIAPKSTSNDNGYNHGVYNYTAQEPTHDAGEKQGSPIHASDHPILYDDGKMAEDFAKKYDSVATSSYKFDTDTTELSFKIYGSKYPPEDEILHEIEIYPRQSSLSLEDALKLAQEYLPMNVMKMWYKLNWSTIYYNYNGESTLYAQLYAPTEDGRKWIKENDNSYNYMLLLVEIKDDKAQNIVLRTTNTMLNTGRGKDACETEEWEYSII